MTFVDVAFVRLLAGAAALLVISAITRTPLARGLKTWGHLFVLSLLLNSVPFTLFSYGETHISAVLTGLINAMTPLATVVITFYVLHHERPNSRILGGLLIGLIGVLIVIGVWKGFGHEQLVGIAACLLAVGCYGFGFPYAHRHLGGRPNKPVALATGQVICGALQMLPFAVFVGHVRHNPPWPSLLALLALGVLGTGVAYTLNFHVVRHASATIASSVTYLTPIFAVIVGAAFLNERVTWNEPVGALLILLGAALAQDRFRRRSRAPTAMK